MASAGCSPADEGRDQLARVCFEEFYHTRTPIVLGRLSRMAKDMRLPSDAAMDALSEAMTRAWQHRFQYEVSRSAFSTWVEVIARRLLIDCQRKQRRQKALPRWGENDQEQELEGREATPEANAECRETEGRIQAALRQLSERDRLVWELSQAGMPHAEVGDLLDLEATQVGMIRHRVRRKLERVMA